MAKPLSYSTHHHSHTTSHTQAITDQEGMWTEPAPLTDPTEPPNEKIIEQRAFLCIS